MKTTEVAAEQVLIGFLVLAAALLPVADLQRALQQGVPLTAAVGFVGVAYLIGVPFDRLADTLLAGVEKWQDARFAERELVTRRAEEEIQAVLLAGGAAAEWLDYLRSRIRVARAVSVYLPALTVSAALGASTQAPAWLKGLVLGLTLVAYGLAFLATPSPSAVWTAHEEVPRPMAVPLLASLPFLGAAALVARASPLPPAALCFSGGVALTALSAWSWWRVRHTMLRFLVRFEKARRGPGGAANRAVVQDDRARFGNTL